jgi:hypothetical protein
MPESLAEPRGQILDATGRVDAAVLQRNWEEFSVMHGAQIEHLQERLEVFLYIHKATYFIVITARLIKCDRHQTEC